MKCPHCQDVALLMSDRQGVEIDYCPQCRGVWLDRGELDKLIERSTQITAAPASMPQTTSPARASAHQPYPAPNPASQRAPCQRDFDDSDFGKRHGYRKPKSWLSEIFD